jgi:hypothetical protein
MVSAPLTSSPLVLRVLVAATAVGAAAAAVLLRLRERAGEVELENEVAARARDEARFEDRVAELEYLAEAAEEQVKRLERRSLAQRSQLARAEGENQRLLRERARLAAEQVAREAEQARLREVAERGLRPTPTAYLKAAAVLRGLERRAAVDRAQRIAGQVARLQVRPAELEPYAQRTAPAQAQVSQQAPQQVAVPVAPAVEQPAEARPAAQEPVAARGPAWARAALPPLRPAATILPSTLSRAASHGLSQGNPAGRPGQPGHGSAGGTFNFFSRQEGAISTHLGRPSADLADVVGDEAAAAQDRYAAGEEQDVYWTASAVGGAGDGHGGRAPEAAAQAVAQHPQAAQQPGEQPGLMDLTAEDETEPIDVRVLRAL